MTLPSNLPGVTPSGVVISPGDEVRDFTKPRNVAYFKIDSDVFELVPAVPALTLLEFAQLTDQQGETQDPQQAKILFERMFSLVLAERSAERLLARMSDKLEPISIEQIQEIIPYVLEKVGLRPTGPSGSSSDSSSTPESGQSSTVNAPLPGSTSGPSLPQGSWTSPTGLGVNG